MTPKEQAQLKELTKTFLDFFELVFHSDWIYTAAQLRQDKVRLSIGTRGTFLKPKVEDEYDNWASRGGLLTAYRELKEFLIRR